MTFGLIIAQLRHLNAFNITRLVSASTMLLPHNFK